MDEALKISIVKGYEKAIYKNIRNFYPFGIKNKLDEEELANTLRMTIYSCLDRYDETKGALSTWIFRYLASELGHDYTRRVKGRGNQYQFEARAAVFSGLAMKAETGDDVKEFTVAVNDDKLSKLLFDEAIGKVSSEINRKIILLYEQNVSFSEIGDMLGMKRQSVQQRYWREVEKLREFYAR